MTLASFGGRSMSVLARVTRLGEFSPNGLLVTFESFWLIIEVAHILEPLVSTVKVMHSFCPKMGWPTFWAIFSQTRLVTLVLATEVCDIQPLTASLES
jgi:hypothetical protein